MKLTFAILAAASMAIGLATVATADSSVDPLDSPLWQTMHQDFLYGEEAVFDDLVGVVMPLDIENSTDVPVAMRFSPELGEVEEVVLIAENNPIPLVARLYPHRPINLFGIKIRLEMSTPVRAAARTTDGVWHVGSEWANVLTPGGCSAPIEFSEAAMGARVGEISFRTFERDDGTDRLKMRIIHPMETGFAFTPEGDEIPAYYVERIELADESGPIADLVTNAAVAPDPIFTIDVAGLRQTLHINARDSEGLEFESFR